MLKIREYIWAKPFKLICIMVLIIIFQAINTLTAVILAKSIDSLLANDFNVFLLLMLLSGILWMAALLGNYFKRILEETYLQILSINLRTKVAELLKNRILEENEEPIEVESYVNMSTNDINMIEDGARSYIDLISIICAAIFSCIALTSFHFSIVTVSLVLGVVIVSIPKIFEKKISEIVLKVSENNKILQNNAFNWINGGKILNYFNSLKLLKTRLRDDSKELAESKVNLEKVTSKVWIVINFLNTLSQLILISLSGFLAYKGIITYGVIISVGNLSSQFFNSLQSFGESYASVLSIKPILSKYRNENGIDVMENDEYLELNNAIKIIDLSYTYGNKKIIYPNMTFEKNKKYVIYGESGVGKTTLFKLLIGDLNKYEGKIYWDDNNYEELLSKKIKNSITYINQKSYIFNDSIKNNIILGKEYDDELFKTSINLSGIDVLINELEEKEDTILSDNNIRLSSGQIQRISLARAFYNDKKIFLIDEGTSNLDRYSSDGIESNLFLNPDLTVIVITHHLSKQTENLSDKIYKIPSR